MMHVFTYGTLMFAEVWRTVVGREFATVRGTAPGFAIYRVAGAVFPGIAAGSETDIVSGVVYLDVDESGLARLDRFEDSFYERQTLWIECDDGQRRPAETYVVPARNRTVLSGECWDGNAFVARGHLTEFIERFAGFARL
jgi:gamma-glutamylcyclotransferase (GGCT)/AIG2-like uncharacterized protein YtfP